MKRFLRWLLGKLGVGVLLLLALGLGYFVRGWFPRPSQELRMAAERPQKEAGVEEPAEPEKQLWICSMNVTYHPYYSSDQPGKCKFCGMPLILAPSGGQDDTGSMRQFVTSPAGRALMDIQVSPVERRFVTAEIRMVGKVEYDETRVRHISAWVPGRLDRLYVDYTGVEVKQGDHMVLIYSPELYAAQEEFLQALIAARDYGEGGSQLMAEMTRSTVQAAREKLRLLGLTKEQVSEVQDTGTPSEHVTIYAPIGGTVIEKNKLEGEYVQTGTRIYTIADFSKVWVKLDAYESDLMWLRYGQKVMFTTEAYPGESFHGTIAFIDPMVNPKTRTVKVRVNVPNPEGRLKPDMFVRAVLRANVALGGRVMDPDLAGQWMCPMHPEVVKPGPGSCDICGMDLVTTESQGYVAAVADDAAKPLVIPVSAALVTGTRAVVYLQVPDADKPTFEGREVVLGLRAGDYYIVRHGLQEGDLVVTRGNFKIDSALQIQAKPSMMTPEGGGGGEHRHGGEMPGETARSAGVGMELPPVVRQQVGHLEGAFRAVSEAMKAEELPGIRAAFGAFGSSLERVEGELLSGHARMVWNELAMLLGNDAFEGAVAEDMDEARRIYALLETHVQRLREQFGTGNVHVEADVLPSVEVPLEFQAQLGKVWEGYLDIHTALAGDDPGAASAALAHAREALEAMDMKLLGGKAHEVWMGSLARLKKALDEMASAEDLETIRSGFAAFSEGLSGAVEGLGIAPAQTVYRLHCPMAFEGKGAIWLQEDEDVRNPYFGAAMLKCGEVVEVISGPRHPREIEHNHDR